MCTDIYVYMYKMYKYMFIIINIFIQFYKNCFRNCLTAGKGIIIYIHKNKYAKYKNQINEITWIHIQIHIQRYAIDMCVFLFCAKWFCVQILKAEQGICGVHAKCVPAVGLWPEATGLIAVAMAHNHRHSSRALSVLVSLCIIWCHYEAFVIAVTIC